jgi:hypothetical protein
MFFVTAMKSNDVASSNMKQIICDEKSNIGSVFFNIPFDHATIRYKDAWKWVVMEILPLISFRWKMRVASGPQGKLSGETLLDVVTTSDLAFAYTVIEWGGRKWASKLDKQNSGAFRDGKDSEETDSPLSYEKKTSEQSATKRGRKKGEEGFASKENIRKFNMHGEALERLLFENENEDNVSSWERAAMMWVNKELGAVDEEDDDIILEVKVNEDKVVPFVPRQRKRNVYVVQV